MLDAFLVARIGQDHAHARIEEGQLAIAMLELLEIELDDLERLGARQEGDLGALLALGRGADDLQRGDRVAISEAHVMLLAVAPDRQVEPFAQRVDHRHADPVEPARHLVGIVVAGVLELTPGVELGHDDLGRRHAFLGVDARRDAAAIVLDRDRPVGVELDQDAVAMPGEQFVDRIVADFEHHVVEPRPVVGVADIHPRPLAHRVEALEDLDRIRAIFILIGIGGHKLCFLKKGSRGGRRNQSIGATPGEARKAREIHTAGHRTTPMQSQAFRPNQATICKARASASSRPAASAAAVSGTAMSGMMPASGCGVSGK